MLLQIFVFILVMHNLEKHKIFFVFLIPILHVKTFFISLDGSEIQKYNIIKEKDNHCLCFL